MGADPAVAAIESALRAALGNAFSARTVEQLGGGCTHRALAVGDGRSRYFVKIGAAQAQPQFAAEADGLAAIANTGTLRTPAMIAIGTDAEHAFLILEHLDIQPLRTSEDATRYAGALADLHHHQGPRFGWHCDNFIGASIQSNGESDNWAHFFVERRLRPQFARAAQAGYGAELTSLGARVMGRTPALFLEYRPQRSLLHGDLWHGNVGTIAGGEPVVFDPACHYGDRESDLAMSELFGGFPAAFYAAYRHSWPIDPGYEQRKPLYSLYHVLNHLNLFGSGYLREAIRIATNLTR